MNAIGSVILTEQSTVVSENPIQLRRSHFRRMVQSETMVLTTELHQWQWRGFDFCGSLGL